MLKLNLYLMLYYFYKNVCGVGPFNNLNFINALLRTYNNSGISPFNIFISTNALLYILLLVVYVLSAFLLFIYLLILKYKHLNFLRTI